MIKIALICVADYNELFTDLQESFKQIRFSLKETLTAFIKNEIIGTGIVTVIWNYKIDQITVTDGLQQCVFGVIQIGTAFF